MANVSREVGKGLAHRGRACTEMQMSERRRLSWRAEERKADFGLFEDSALEDLDFDLVFDPAWDGYAEETSLA